MDERCGNCRLPKTNKNFWKKKFSENIDRDKKNLEKLRCLGWKTVSVWECDLVEKSSLINLEKELLD